MPEPGDHSVSAQTRRSWTTPKLLAASALLPPFGIVLWWMRPWSGGWLRRGVGFVARLVVTFALVVLTVFYLVKLNLVHVELSGAGWQPMFSLRDPKLDQEALEQHRAAQHAPAAPVASQPAPDASPARDPGAPAGAAPTASTALAAPVPAAAGAAAASRPEP
jgi:hypothetical protein